MHRHLLPICAAALLACAAAWAEPPQETAPPRPAPVYAPTSLAPTSAIPRTPDGHPDFQGAVWATNFFPVFEATPLAATLVVSEEQARKMVDMMLAGFLRSTDPNIKIDPELDTILMGSDGLPVVRGERRSRLVVMPATGKVPLTPEARKEARTTDPLDSPHKDNPEERPAGERCLALSGQPPIAVTIAYNRLRIVQTPSHVVIHNENGDEARLIPFAATHPGPGINAPWLGDSTARWDGDTLVIETVGMPDSTRVRGFNSFVVGANSKVIERLTRLSADELLYQFTVEDPQLYTAPWLAEYSFHRANTPMFPSPCHEGNYSLGNILKGQRVADARPRPRSN